MERMMDIIAAELGMDPALVRMRNLIPASEMPYRLGLPYRDGEPIVYDSGDYPESLRLALDAIGGLENFRERQSAARKNGRFIGLGLGCYVEGTGVGPFESATVRIDPSGKIYVAGGACAQGQGMETIFSQIAADAWKVDPADVMITLADTSAIPIGFGTIASRSTVTLSGAIHNASEILRKKVFAIASHLLECSPDDLELRNGTVGIVGVPGNEISLKDIAAAARPGWDNRRPEGVSAGLEETAYFEPPTVTWAYATHAAIIEVDPELGHLKFEKYVIVHDCGVVVNPMLVDGQIHGGAVQGLGGAMLEEIEYDSEGQLLVGSFMDYLVPGASDVPDIQIVHMHSPSPLNPLGVKGVGEGSAIAPPVVVANAVCDALSELKIEFNSTPVKPEQVAAAFGFN
jgi:carbon-monoxide dehydrogenase large subunit